jgi:U3 small nucleolar RNA-associated protein 19
MEEISEVRDKERLVLADVRHANELVHIIQLLDDENRPTGTRNACIHSLRRVFSHYLEKGQLAGPDKKQKEPRKKAKEDPALKQFRDWLYGRYTAFIGSLARLVKGDNVDLQVHAIRTLLEIAKKEHALDGSTAPALGLKTFALLVRSLVAAPALLNDVVAMVKEEITSHADCAVAALVAVTNYVSMVAKDEEEERRQSDKFNTHNAVALLMTIRPDELDLDPAAYLVPSEKDALAAAGGDESDDDESDNEEKQEAAAQQGDKRKKKRKLEGVSAEADGDARRRKFNKIYSKAWLAVLRRPMSSQEYKTVLKWLPDHVLPYCNRPLELADFLTDSYNQGGAISLLALNGLFALIRDHNLDYPKFFPSLYKLCSTETFLAKYRAKFFRLLHLCLKSSNLPAYAIAAFLKRYDRRLAIIVVVVMLFIWEMR